MLEEVKNWLKIDEEDEDVTLSSLILTAQSILKESTGFDEEFILRSIEEFKDETILLNKVKRSYELYKTIIKIIVTNLYENRDSGLNNKVIIGMCIQLQSSLKDLRGEYGKENKS